MNRVYGIVGMAVIATLVLAACEVRVSVSPRFPDAVRVSAVTTRDDPVSQGELRAGESIVYRVRVDSSVAAAGDLLYTEVDTGTSLSMVQYRSDGTPFASSRRPEFFASGLAALDAADVLAPQEVITTRVCRGACVIRDAGTGTVFVELENQTGSRVSYSLFAFVEDFQDEHEPGNRSRGGAVPLIDFDSGALETLGDVDWFVADRDGDFRFSSDSEVRPRAEIRTADGEPLSPPEILMPGETRQIFAGETIRVFSEDRDRAAAAGHSFYVVEIE